MNAPVFESDRLRILVGRRSDRGRAACFVEAIQFATPAGWQTILSGAEGREFATSFGARDADRFDATIDGAGNHVLRLSCRGEDWEAESRITLDRAEPVIRREQTYRFLRDCQGAVHPGWTVRYDRSQRYTFAPHVHEQPFAAVPALRADAHWTLTLPFHVWHNDDWVALYGLDRRGAAGTLDFAPGEQAGMCRLRCYFPDVTQQAPLFYRPARIPETARLAAGTTLTFREIIAVKPLAQDEEPLLEAERIAVGLLWTDPARPVDCAAVAAGVARFYANCDLWEPDALGPGRGWFLNMWLYTHRGTGRKHGPMSLDRFDLGWGEGNATEAIHAIARHHQRTGDRTLLPCVDEITRNLPLFKRAPQPNAPYYDRSDGKRFGDFSMRPLIWTHSLAHCGNQLLMAYRDCPDYANAATRRQWWQTASEMGGFLAQHQRPDGDLPDIFDEHDQEANRKPHRIAARAAACGLWTHLAAATRDPALLDRALRLAAACAPEIENYAYYNQMIDTYDHALELSDGEAAYYALEGLAALYAATHDARVLALCRKAAAFGIAWTCFFDMPTAYRGVARGGQICRMPDYPLLYPIGPAKAVAPLLTLHRATGDAFYERMTREMIHFIAHQQVHAPGQPWHGGMVHAQLQCTGQLWFADEFGEGQIDSGMATGNSLAALECWLAHSTTHS